MSRCFPSTGDMSAPRRNVSKTVSLAGAAVFGALAAIATIVGRIYPLRFPVPGFQFLQFDLAELIDVLAFLVFGPIVGFLTTGVHGAVLSISSSDVPLIGPFLKFTAVTSMLLGIWLGYRVYVRVLKARVGARAGFGLMTGLGLVTRVLIMTPINYLFLILFFTNPDSPPSVTFVALYLGWIGVFNAIHAVISIVIPYIVMDTLLRTSPQLEARAWFSEFLKLPRTLRGKT